jgi:HAE1 family hydrophobic/amphiphilic exporter-1/multidrug efflux pump
VISKFFIERPRTAAVLAIVIIIAGLLSIQVLPVKEYPTLTPPQITITAVYPGADAETIGKTVAAPLEEEINGVENMIYMTSTASSSGVLNMSVFFEVGTDSNVAKMNLNNRVQTALSKLPEAVRRQGLQVRERTPDLLKVFAVVSEGNKRDMVSLSNYIIINILDDIKRVPGVGDAIVFDEKRYSIRVWLKPDKLARLGLTPVDVFNAVSSQNEQFSAGGLAQEPIKNSQVYSYSIKGERRFETVREFEDIIIRSAPDGSSIRLKDIATVELSSESFNRNSFYKGQPAIPVGIFLSPGANALDVSDRLDGLLKELSKEFPPDIKYHIPFDPTVFVRESIKEVLITLGIAILLVVFVVYIFLGSMRATIIPVLAIPVSIIGTFAGLYAFGFSINLLTLFGLILAIGLVVDDAIIVIENVERIMREQGLPPKEATIKAMEEITAPVIAIVLVLSAVFIPASFVGGFSGKLYQQFAITIAISVIISGIVALTLTPSLCALFLKEHEKISMNGVPKKSKTFWGAPIRLFQEFFDQTRKGFVKGVRLVIRLAIINIVLFSLMLFATYILIKRLPTALVPVEDKAAILFFTYLPPGSSLERTEGVVHNIEGIFSRTPEVNEWVAVSGLDLQTFAFRTDSAVGWVRLKDWSHRKGRGQSSMELAGRLMGQFMQNREGLAFAVNPPPIMGMSTTGGFELYVQDRTGGSLHELSRHVQELVARANQRPELMSVRTTLNTNVPYYSVRVDREKAKALGVEISDIYNTLSMTFGSTYINDFNLFGRVFHVNLQSEGEFRDDPRDYSYVFVKSRTGELVPLSSLITIERTADAMVIERFNMFPAAKVTGEPKPGFTSGDAIKAISEVAKEVLPPGYTISWAGTSFQEVRVQEKGNVALIYAIVFVFLILVALYESWSAPLAIILSVPFAVFGAVLGLTLRGLENDIYFQVGLITLIGLSAKNAILIVEFAEERFKRLKMPLIEAAVEASRIRYRPIVMTSFAFIAGTLPLALSTGAGANSRHIIGTTVVAGMLFATVIGIFFIPLFYYLVMRAKEKIIGKEKIGLMAIFILSISLLGCSFTPELKKPDMELPSSRLPSGIKEEDISKGKVLQPDWWRQFNDPVLNALIDEALKNNDDLLIAASRIEQARALLGISSAELYPLITAGAGASRTKTSEEVSNNGKGTTSNNFSLTSMVSYEIDLWGRLRNEKEANLRRLLSTEAAREGLRLSIISSVISTYFNILSVEQQLRTAEEIMLRQKDIYEFRQKQWSHGVIDELIVEQARSEYQSTRVIFESLKTQREILKSSLSLLLGKSPKEIFEKTYDLSKEMPEVPPLPPFIPSEVLQKRPDIIQAEENLKAANLEVGVARAAYFPRISLTGLLGLQSSELGNLIQSSAVFWNIGANATMPLLDFGRTRGNVKLKEAQKEEALLQYIKTVRTAFKEVYDGLVSLEQSMKRLDTQKEQLESLEKVLRLSEKKYEKGLTDYLTVLDSQRGYLNARLNLIRLRAEVLNNYVFLYKALGVIGGEEVRD